MLTHKSIALALFVTLSIFIGCSPEKEPETGTGTPPSPPIEKFKPETIEQFPAAKKAAIAEDWDALDKMICSNPELAQYSDSDGNNLLLLVSQLRSKEPKDRKEIVKRLLDLGANVNARNAKGETPLSIATISFFPDIALTYIDHGADIDWKSKDGKNMMYLAAYAGSDKMIRILSEKGIDVNTRDDKGWTALHYAASWGSSRAVNPLINCGANINIKNKEGQTPVFLTGSDMRLFCYAPMDKDNFPKGVIKAFVDAGIPVKQSNEHKETLLHIAARYCRLEAVQFLIDRGADISAKTKDGKTPLHYSMHNVINPEITKFLIQKGADVNAADNDGNTPMHYLSGYLPVPVEDTILLLIENGADINARNKAGKTRLDIAKEERHPNEEFIELLKKHGAQ